MGLLDDAIREHLELKRLRGADPGEVAREQREALDPVPRDRHVEQDMLGEHNARSAALGGDVGEIEIAAVTLHEEGGHKVPQPVRGTDFSHVGQETAELDMRTVLGEELNAPQGNLATTRPAEGGGGETSADGHPREDSLEWDVREDVSGEEQEEDSARHEHFADEDDPRGRIAKLPGDVEESAEDVLEETPDFLRDTPEQERLWFEQRPPRDFDFDK